MRAAGLAHAIVSALRNHAAKNIQGQVLNMLGTFLAALAQKSKMADFAAESTTAELVAGGVAECAVDNAVEHMDVAEWDQHHIAINMLTLFSYHPGGLERLAAPGTVDRLMMAINKWLLQVCVVVAIWGSRH